MTKLNLWAVCSASLGFLILFSSCVNTRKATYFNNEGNAEFLSQYEDLEPELKENDLLSISVSSMNPEASAMFNAPNISTAQITSATGLSSPASGYLVDQDGYIRFPFLGEILAAGKTKKALRDEIQNKLIEKGLLIDPIVNVRYLNYKISVLGEVGDPSVITIPDEKVTILQALGLAGDMTLYANREEVLLIREEGGVKKLINLDLTTEEIFNSPYYYLKSNDVIYVEANRSKIASTSRSMQWLPVITSILTMGIIAIDRLVVN